MEEKCGECHQIKPTHKMSCPTKKMLIQLQNKTDIMSKIKVSHETPFCLLEKSLEFNDMQYCLPHLMESNEEYRNFFLKCVEDGVEIYLDNSLHELGYALEDDILIKWMNILKPSTFFIPDVWEDSEQSIVNAKRWADIDVPEGVTKCAIVQAKSMGDAQRCVNKYIELGYTKIAFSYGASYYNDICPHPNKDFGKAIGRFILVNSMFYPLISMGISVHLLGTSWPAEFGMYKNNPLIESIDTSNPIMAAIEGQSYGNLGLEKKPVANMNNFQTISKDNLTLEIIEYNVRKFREINDI
jgi:hypothetical protein